LQIADCVFDTIYTFVQAAAVVADTVATVEAIVAVRCVPH
jgi:hypothetical protein